MREILFEYEMNPTTWVYLSSLMIVGIYFKFHRFWSVRNLDLVGLIVLAPGLLLVSRHVEPTGYVWLFIVSGCFLVRLLLDPWMVRRPLLEPNLSASGLTFSGAALMVFLVANILTVGFTTSDVEGAKWMDRVLARQAAAAAGVEAESSGPGYPLFQIFANFSRERFSTSDKTPPEEYRRAQVHYWLTRAAAILAHLAVVVGMVLIGYRHFDNAHTGVAAACMYLLLPYTAQFAPCIYHVAPAALLVWAVEAYRRPLLAGLLLGAAAAFIFYPLFLLPLWCGFYWRRGLVRFLVGFGLAMLLLTASLALFSANAASFWVYLQQMFHLAAYPLGGFWKNHEAVFRTPVEAAFWAMSIGLALWPAQKNLGALLSCSAAVMLAAQFWHPNEGGTYLAWYLPLLILTILRPNLEDRVALSAVSEGWGRWRRSEA